MISKFCFVPWQFLAGKPENFNMSLTLSSFFHVLLISCHNMQVFLQGRYLTRISGVQSLTEQKRKQLW